MSKTPKSNASPTTNCQGIPSRFLLHLWLLPPIMAGNKAATDMVASVGVVGVWVWW